MPLNSPAAPPAEQNANGVPERILVVEDDKVIPRACDHHA